jgi:hypothetical protein
LQGHRRADMAKSNPLNHAAKPCETATYGER